MILLVIIVNKLCCNFRLLFSNLSKINFELYRNNHCLIFNKNTLKLLIFFIIFKKYFKLNLFIFNIFLLSIQFIFNYFEYIH